MEACANLYSAFQTGLRKDLIGFFTRRQDLQSAIALDVPFLIANQDTDNYGFTIDSMGRLNYRAVDWPSMTEDTLVDLIVASRNFGKEFERCAILGIDFPIVATYQKVGMRVDMFTQYVLERYVDARALSSDKLVTEACAYLFRWIRQFFLGFSKVETLECRGVGEVESFVKRMMRSPNLYALSADPYGEFRKVVEVARRLLRQVLLSEDGELCAPLQQWIEEPYGSHGPGAVAEGEEGREKWHLKPSARLGDRIFQGNTGNDFSTLDYQGDPRFVSRLVLVPKDVTKHRLICVEPKELMFAQQGLMKVLYEHITHHFLTRTSIYLFDQTHNFYAARRRGHATIDLTDASDLLSLKLLKLLLPKKVFDLLTRYRASGIELPDGQLLYNYSAAFTMGNALCFPTETLIFWALSLAACIVEESRITGDSYCTDEDLLSFSRRFRVLVFGDDIIVPEQYFIPVCEALATAGLDVNKNKSCGPLTPVRESCGSFWFENHDVRIVKFTSHATNSVSDAVSLWSQIPTVLDYGFPNLAEVLRSFLEKSIPCLDSSRDSIARGLKSGNVRWNSQFQRLEARVPRFEKISRVCSLPGDVGLYAYFTSQATRPVSPGNAQCVVWEWLGLDSLPAIE